MRWRTVHAAISSYIDIPFQKNGWCVQLICARMRRPFATATIIILVLVLLYEFNLQQTLMKENIFLSDRAGDLQVSLEVCRNKEGLSNAFLLRGNDEISIQTGTIDVNVKNVVEAQKKKHKSFDSHRLVHIDLKGAPPKMAFLLQTLPFLKEIGVTGFLMEYEDMFPYSGNLGVLKSKYAYSEKDIQEFLRTAASLDLLVMPLVQTFGHLEFVLKHDKFKHLRESENYANAPCPSKKESQDLAIEMVDQVLALHPGISYLHVGGDEVFNFKSCKECIGSGKSLPDLYLHHMVPILEHIKTKTGGDVRPVIWDDMLRKWTVDDMQKLSKLTDIMIWGYAANLDGYPLFPSGMFEKFASVFDKLWIASSFKGARGPNVNMPPIKMHIDNHLSWLKLISSFKNTTTVTGIAMTGWARFDHFATLCELFPAAIPSLTLCLQVLKEGEYNKHVVSRVGSLLGFKDGVPIVKDPFVSYAVDEGKFPGSEVYSLVAELENHLSWYSDNKIRLDSWANDRQIKEKAVSMLQVEGVKASLKMLIPSLRSFEDKVRVVLPKYFNPSLVEEWVTDKIAPCQEQANSLALRVQGIIADNEETTQEKTTGKPTAAITPTLTEDLSL